MGTRSAFWATALSGIFAISGTLNAQTPAAGDGDTAGNGETLGDIVVTAQRRAERLRYAPWRSPRSTRRR